MRQRSGYLLVQVVTCARIPAALIAIPFVIAGGPANYAIAFALYLFGEITDVLDGNLARAYKLESQFGKLFDPYCDSVCRLCVFFTLCLPSVGILPPWVVWVMAVRDVTVAYARMAALSHGVVISARLSGKLKAIVQGTAACSVLAIRFLPWFEPVIDEMTIGFAILVVAVTGWSLVDYTTSVLRMISRMKEPA